MDSYQIYQVAMDCNAPPGITHPLFKENYAWIDEELEKREEIFSSKRLTPVSLNWLYKYGERRPFYQPLEEEEEGEEYEYEDDRQYEYEEYDDEYEAEYEAEEEDYDKLEYDKYAYHINRIDQMWNNDIREVCSPSMPTLINLNDLHHLNDDWEVPFARSLLHDLHMVEEGIQEEQEAWKRNEYEEKQIQEAPLPYILEILHDEDIAVLDADDMAVLDVEEME